MKNVDKNLVQESMKKFCQGLASKIGVSLLGAAFILAPLGSKADSVTQLQFLQTIAQLSGASGQFNANSTAADYVHWAQSKGINPAGGWQPGSALTKAALAQSLVQAMNLNPNKFGGDYARILAREGIDLSGVGDQVSKDSLVSVLDQPGMVITYVAPKGGPAYAPNPVLRPPGGGPDKITICHRTGAAGHSVTITISKNALDAHLAHGDTIGSCQVTQ